MINPYIEPIARALYVVKSENLKSNTLFFNIEEKELVDVAIKSVLSRTYYFDIKGYEKGKKYYCVTIWREYV
jgi:hypothetical protein